jgi:hypothetical protein
MILAGGAYPTAFDRVRTRSRRGLEDCMDPKNNNVAILFAALFIILALYFLLTA